MKKVLFLFTILLGQKNVAMEDSYLALIADANKQEGLNLFSQGKFPEAKKYFTLSSGPSGNVNAQITSLAQLAKISINIDNDLKAGKEYISQAKKIEGGDSLSRAILAAAQGMYAQETNKPEEALNYYKKVFLVDLEPTSGLAGALRFSSAEIYEKQGKQKEAKVDYILALKALHGETPFSNYWGKKALDKLNVLAGLVKISQN